MLPMFLLYALSSLNFKSRLAFFNKAVSTSPNMCRMAQTWHTDNPKTEWRTVNNRSLFKLTWRWSTVSRQQHHQAATFTGWVQETNRLDKDESPQNWCLVTRWKWIWKRSLLFKTLMVFTTLLSVPASTRSKLQHEDYYYEYSLEYDDVSLTRRKSLCSNHNIPLHEMTPSSSLNTTLWQKEAYLLRLAGLEGVFEDFHSAWRIHVFPLGAHHEGEEVPQLLHEGQVPVFLVRVKTMSNLVNQTCQPLFLHISSI